MNIHILALSPNAARLSVRFYLTNTFGAFACNIERHYQDVAIRRPNYDTTTFLPTWRLLNQTIRAQSKNAKVSAEMAGAVMKAILNDTAYPVTLINRIKGTEKTSRANTSPARQTNRDSADHAKRI